MFLVDQLLLLAAVLIFLGIISSKLSEKFGVPTLILFIGIGILAGSEGVGGIEFKEYQLAHALGTVALGVILFDGGLRTSWQAVRRAWKPAGVLATVGVMIKAGVTGAAAAWLLGVDWYLGMLLGAIVSSTDAAAVFSILRNQGVHLDERLAATLEVESGANDPMAIFLTLVFIELVSATGTSGWEMGLLFANQMVVGALMGWLAGRAGVWLLNHIELEAPGLYPVLAIVIGMIAFGAAAMIGGSGFLAIYVAGIIIGNGDVVFRRGIFLFHDGIAWMAQIVMFTVLGLLVVPSGLVAVTVDGFLIALVLMFVARPLSVAATMPFFGYNWRELCFLSWVGLKGAVPIILAILPLLFAVDGAQLIFDVVFFVVLMSALIQGWTMPQMARLLKLDRPGPPDPPAMLEISSLTRLDTHIVDFVIGSDRVVAGLTLADIPLPQGAIVAMLSRDDELVAPQAGTRLRPNDHVFIIVPRRYRPFVDHLFWTRPDQSLPPLPRGVEIPFRPRTTLVKLEKFYGICLPGNPEMTLQDLLSDAGDGSMTIGTKTSVGPADLIVRDLTDGAISQIGLSLRP